MAQESEQVVAPSAGVISKVKSSRPRKPRSSKVGWVGGIVGAFIIGTGSGVALGMQISKSSSQPVEGMVPNGQMQQPSGGGNRRGRGETGTVTTISSDSITIKSSRGEAEIKYTITDSTTVTDNGETASVGDIQVGDTVRVQTGTTDGETTTATNIEVNPTENIDRGGPGGNAPTNAGGSGGSQSSTKAN